MGCTIKSVLTKNKQDSELFKSLQRTLGDAIALETYLELSANERGYAKIYGRNEQGEVNYNPMTSPPLFKYEEFDSYQQMEDTMDNMAERVIDAIKGFGNKESKSTLSPINLEGLTSDPLVLQRIITEVRRGIKEDMLREDYSENELRLLQTAYDGLPGYLGSEGNLGRLGLTLQDYGIDISVQESYIEQEVAEADETWEADPELVDVENESGGPFTEQLYNMTIMDINPVTTILKPLKLHLKRLPRVHKDFAFDKNNPLAEPTYELGELGLPRPVNFEILYDKIKKVMLGVQTVEQMHQKIADALPTTPELIPLYRQLMAEKPVNIKGIGSYKKLNTAMMSLSKADSNMISFVDFGGGDMSIQYANSTTVESRVKQQWAENILKIKEMNANGTRDREKNIKAIASFIHNPKNKKRINKVKKVKRGTSYVLVDAPNRVVLGAAATLFKNNGFSNITTDDLIEVIQAVKKNPYLLSEKGTKVSAESVITTMLTLLPAKVSGKEDVDIFSKEASEKGESKALGVLADAVSKRTTDVFTGAFLSGRGTVIHPSNLSSEAQDVVNRMMTDGGVSKQLFRNDPMYTDSILLDLIGTDSKESAMFEVQTVDVLKDNKQGKGVVYGKLSSFDALGLKVNAFFGPRKNSRFFHAFSPTLGDRGTMMMMVVPKLAVDTDGNAVGLRTDKGTITNKEIKSWVENQTKAEITRMARTTVGNFKNYSMKVGRGKEAKLQGNAHRFNLFPGLNTDSVTEHLKDLDNTKESIEAATRKILPSALDAFSQMLDSDSKYLVDKGLFAEHGRNFQTTKKAKSILGSRVGTPIKGSSIQNFSKSQMDSFLANNFIYGYEQALLLAGDPAFFKDGTKDPSIQMVDMNKRFTLTQTPGVKPVVGETTGMNPTAKIVILKEGEIDAPNKKFFATVLGDKFKNSYTDIELADGQGYVSLDRYRRMLVSRGMHNDGILKLLDDLESWKPGDKHPDTAASIAAIKNFYYKINSSKNGVMVPFSLKYAIFPAIPALFEAVDANGKELYPTMAVISRTLRQGKADEVVMESGVKVGIRDVQTIKQLANNKNIPYTQIDNDGLRIPQVTPTATKLSDRAGSQIRKQIMGNFNPTGTLDLGVRLNERLSIVGSSALAYYDKAISYIVEEGGRSVKKELLEEDGTANVPNLIKKLLSDLKTNPHNNSEFFREALSMVDGDTMLPLEYPTVANKMDNLVNALFRRKVNRFKLPGHSAVQISSYGMEARKDDGSLSISSDLKFLRVKSKESGTYLEEADALKVAAMIQRNRPEDKAEIEKYTIQPAEVRVTPKFFLGKLREIAKKNVEKSQMDEIRKKVRKRTNMFKSVLSPADLNLLYKSNMKAALSKAAETEFSKLKKSVSDSNGNILADKLRAEGLDSIVIYRIPTQLKNSALPVTIKEFLPEYSGNTIQVPAEVVEQAGSDFDIDKVYMEFRDFYLDENGDFKGYDYVEKQGDEDVINIDSKEKAQAYIMDFHRAVLTSPHYLAEVLLPNNTQTLTEIVEGYGYNNSYLTRSFPTIETQEVLRESNMAGKQLISVSSIASVLHSVSKHIGAKFIKPPVINGVPIELGLKNNLESRDNFKNNISFELFQIQNAALDNARDPLLGKLNITLFTSPVMMLMVAAGHGLKFGADVLNAPIIKDLSQAYQTYERTRTPSSALKAAVREVKASYGINATTPVTHKLDKYTPEVANSYRTDVSPGAQNTALNMFLDLLDIGEELGKFYRVMNIDSKGTPSSVPKLIDVHAELASIPGTMSDKTYKTFGTNSILGEYDIKPEKSLLQVGPGYATSHLAAMELHGIIEPLRTNTVTSPNASLQMIQVLKVAKDMLGYLDEGQQLKLLAQYNTFLTHNTEAYSVESTDLSKRIKTGKHLKLSEKGHPEATATLIDDYRHLVNSDSNRSENLFVENLSIVTKGNRRFVTFNNTVSAGMTKGLKESMMFHFEDLMYSKDPAERRLARSLADYGIIHYGFEKSINSFVDLLPPTAHTDYMGHEDGKTKNSLSEFFRNLSYDLNDKEMFGVPADKFVRMYVRNNGHKLKLEYVNTSDLEWKDELLNRPKAPRFVKGRFKGESVVFEKVGFNYVRMKPLGIPNLALEYHGNKDSDFHGSEANVEMQGAQGNKSKENQIAEQEIDGVTNLTTGDFASFKDVFNQVGDFETMDFTPATAQGYVNRVVDFIDQNSKLGSIKQTSINPNVADSTSLQLVKDILDSTVRMLSSKPMQKIMAKKGIPYSVAFRQRLNSIIKSELDMIPNYKLNEIKTCNS